jgi:hypothetical protein
MLGGHTLSGDHFTVYSIRMYSECTVHCVHTVKLTIHLQQVAVGRLSSPDWCVSSVSAVLQC